VKIFAIGSSLTSSYWNGAATYYRGIYRGLAELGHQITFAEPDAYGRQQHRDNVDLSYANSVVYQTPRDLSWVMSEASEADLVVKHSGVGIDDEWLELEVLNLRSARTRVAYWDVDAPATLARVEADHADPFRPAISQYDFIFTYGGGPPIVDHYTRLGAVNCHPIYNAHDPSTHHPVEPSDALRCDLAFVGNRLPDREARVEQFFLQAAALAPEMKFVLGGEGWGSKRLPENVRWIGHVGTGDHNVVNCSARMVLNINRNSMADVGFSPPTRVFEAAGAAACVITDEWTGIDQFFVPRSEILIAKSAGNVVSLLRTIDPATAMQIGQAMRDRALHEHTYTSRAREVDQILAAFVQSREVNTAA
jgi:spore maturation protein CgeB